MRDAITRAAAGELVRFETTHPAKDGSLHYVDFSLKPVTDETGAVVMLLPEGRDITESKRAEQALRDSEQHFGQVVNRALVGVYRTTMEGQFVLANPATLRIFGYDTVEAFNAAGGVPPRYAGPKDRQRLLASPLAELAAAYFDTMPDAFRRPDTLLDEYLRRELAAGQGRGNSAHEQRRDRSRTHRRHELTVRDVHRQRREQEEPADGQHDSDPGTGRRFSHCSHGEAGFQRGGFCDPPPGWDLGKETSPEGGRPDARGKGPSDGFGEDIDERRTF